MILARNALSVRCRLLASFEQVLLIDGRLTAWPQTKLRGLGFDPALLMGAKGFARIKALADAVNAVYSSDETERRYIELESGDWIKMERATVAEWRGEQRLALRRGERCRRGVNQMIRLARILAIPDDVPLYLCLLAIAKPNVVPPVIR
jgi:hypothetical protein